MSATCEPVTDFHNRALCFDLVKQVEHALPLKTVRLEVVPPRCTCTFQNLTALLAASANPKRFCESTLPESPRGHGG